MSESRQHRVCVSIGRPDILSAVEAARRIASLADVLEIRLDCLENPSIPAFLSALHCPLLFTNRPTWEGGFYTGPEEERIALLAEAITGGAAYVDLELQAPAASLQRLRAESARSGTRLILSRHDFSATPGREELVDWLRAMRDGGGDIGKIVTTAHDYHDVLRVLHLQEEAAAMDFPLIAFCMGQSGLISRLATLDLGGYMTYCAVDVQEATAPGQIAVTDMRRIYAILHHETIKTGGEIREEGQAVQQKGKA
jgi:3-dehydroquinate dehydratase-1/3-dehydroquinate dehydratase/shikimate dehydrogenase